MLAKVAIWDTVVALPSKFGRIFTSPVERKRTRRPTTMVISRETTVMITQIGGFMGNPAEKKMVRKPARMRSLSAKGSSREPNEDFWFQWRAMKPSRASVTEASKKIPAAIRRNLSFPGS